MIELTDEQANALGTPGEAPARAIDPRTRRQYVLVPLDEYERLAVGYDDSGWTRDELAVAAWDAGRSVGWEDMAEYDDPAAGS